MAPIPELPIYGHRARGADPRQQCARHRRDWLQGGCRYRKIDRFYQIEATRAADLSEMRAQLAIVLRARKNPLFALQLGPNQNDDIDLARLIASLFLKMRT